MSTDWANETEEYLVEKNKLENKVVHELTCDDLIRVLIERSENDVGMLGRMGDKFHEEYRKRASKVNPATKMTRPQNPDKFSRGPVYRGRGRF